MILVPINHICLDERGVAYIIDTKIRIATIAIDATTWAMEPEQIQQNYPYLSLGQVHAALAYYFDHREEIDRQIDESNEEYKRLRAAKPNPITRKEFESRLNKDSTRGT